MTAKAVRAYTEGRMAEAGTTLSVVIVARILAAEPGLSQREVASRMHLRSPTVTRHLDRMAADGLIARERDPDDRRVQRIHLTDAGAAALARLERVAASADRALTAVLDADELATLEGLLDRLADRARELQDQEVPA